MEVTQITMGKTFFGSPENAVHGYHGVVVDTPEYARVEVLIFYITSQIEAVEVMVTKPLQTDHIISNDITSDGDDIGYYMSIGNTSYYRTWCNTVSGGRSSIADDLRNRYGIELDFSQV